MPPHLPKGNNIVPDHETRAAENKHYGPLIGTLIIVVLLLLVGLYLWGAQLNRQNSPSDLPVIPGDATTAAP